MGTLRASLVPSSIRIANRNQSGSSVTVALRYSGESPPRINKVDVSLIARTSRCMTHGPLESSYETSRTDTHPLQSIKLGTEDRWQHSHTENQTWLSELSIPVINTDDSAAILPSFNACLASRSYTLKLKLSLSSMRSVELSYPISILSSMESAKEVSDIMPDYIAVMASPATTAPIAEVPEYNDPIPAYELDRRPEWMEKEEEPDGSVSLIHHGHIARAC